MLKFREVNILIEMNGWNGPFCPVAALIHMAQAQHLFCLVLGSWGIDTHGPEQITSEHITTEDHLALSHQRMRTHTGTVKCISLYSLHIPLAEECGEESYLLGTLKRLRLLAG